MDARRAKDSSGVDGSSIPQQLILREAYGELQSYAVLPDPGSALVIGIPISVHGPGWIRQWSGFEARGSPTT